MSWRRNGGSLVYDPKGVEGGHHTLRHPERDGKVTVAMYRNETLPPKTLKSILVQAGFSKDELREAL